MGSPKAQFSGRCSSFYTLSHSAVFRQFNTNFHYADETQIYLSTKSIHSPPCPKSKHSYDIQVECRYLKLNNDMTEFILSRFNYSLMAQQFFSPLQCAASVKFQTSLSCGKLMFYPSGKPCFSTMVTLPASDPTLHLPTCY